MVYANEEKRKLNEINKYRRRVGTPKQKARDNLRMAVARGEIIKPKHCSKCNSSKYQIEAHHEDYLRPYDVTWLCKPCHHELHKDLFIKAGSIRSNYIDG